MFGNVLSKIISNLRKKQLENRIAQERTQEEFLVTRNYEGHSTPLTEEEKTEVRKVWGQVVDVTSFKELEMYKHEMGFDPRTLSHHIYLPLVVRRLNDFFYCRLYENKSLLGYIVKPRIKTAKVYFRQIKQELYSDDMIQLSKEQAIEKVMELDEYIIKDSNDTGGGWKVKKVVQRSDSREKRIATITKLITNRRPDFVVQEVLKQHPTMSQFNKSSVNTFRFTTLYLNGKFSVCSIGLRFGREGMNVDNWGGGGLLLGVKPDGSVTEFAYDKQLNKYYEQNGLIYKNVKIEQIPAISKLIEEVHTHDYPLHKLVGWDITINQYNEPVLIEMNGQCGLTGEQVVNGHPVFGDRTQEVIDYIKNKPFTYEQTMYTY